MTANENFKNHGKPVASGDHSLKSGSKESFPLFRQAGLLSPHDTATDKHFVAIMALIIAIGIITPIVMGGFAGLAGELAYTFSNNPTLTPTAAPTATAAKQAPAQAQTTNDPTLKTVESLLKSKYAAVTEFDSPNSLWFQLNTNGANVSGHIMHDASIDDANAHAMSLFQQMGQDKQYLTPVITGPHFEPEQIATAALGHTPTAKFYASFKEVGSTHSYEDLVQYDTLVLRYNALT